MTPGAIISLIKDAIIIIAIGLVVYFLINYGKDIVKISDMKALQKQIQANADTIEKWRKESIDADTKRSADLAQVAATIDKQHTPVFVRNPPGSCTVPSTTSKAGDQPSQPAGSDQGRGIDYRPAVNQYESKYSTALIECYAALDKWPSQ